MQRCDGKPAPQSTASPPWHSHRHRPAPPATWPPGPRWRGRPGGAAEGGGERNIGGTQLLSDSRVTCSLNDPRPTYRSRRTDCHLRQRSAVDEHKKPVLELETKAQPVPDGEGLPSPKISCHSENQSMTSRCCCCSCAIEICDVPQGVTRSGVAFVLCPTREASCWRHFHQLQVQL